LLHHLKKGSDLHLYADEESSSKTLPDTKDRSPSSSQPQQHHQEQSTSSPPPPATNAILVNKSPAKKQKEETETEENRTEKKTQRRRGGKASHTRLTPTTAIPHHLHLHEVAIEREEQR
jgi:hypothetical protein